MSDFATSSGQSSNSDSTNEQAVADQLEPLMTGLPERMLTSNLVGFGFSAHDLGAIPMDAINNIQVIPAWESASNEGPSVDSVPMDTSTTTSRDEMRQRIDGELRERQFVTWRSMESLLYSCAYVEPFTKEIFLLGDR